MSAYHSIAKVSSPGVVTGRYGTLGEVFYIEEDFWPLNTTLYVRDFKGNDPRFLSYFLRTLNLEQQNTAGAVPGLNRNALHLLPVSIPPTPTQRKIATILSAYDDLIENNTRRIAILEEMAQSLYREWFVHFRFPGHEKKSMVEPSLGMIPEGWEVVKSSDAMEIDPPTKVLKDGEKPFISMAGLSTTSLLIETFEVRRGNSGSKFKNGKIGFVQFSPSDQAVAFGSTEFIVLRSFDKFLIAHPDNEILATFSEQVEPIFRNIYILAQKNVNLRRTRDLLLPKLISGEVDVEELEIAGVAAGLASAPVEQPAIACHDKMCIQQ